MESNFNGSPTPREISARIRGCQKNPVQTIKTNPNLNTSRVLQRRIKINGPFLESLGKKKKNKKNFV